MNTSSNNHQERRRNIKSNRNSFSSFYRLLDMAIITMVYLFILLASQISINLTSMVLLLVCIVSYNFCAELMSLYRFGRAPSNFVMLKTISMVWCLAGLLTATFAFILPSAVPYRTNMTLVVNFALTLPTLIVLRALITQMICFIRIKGYNTRTAIIIGTTPSGYNLANQFTAEKHLGVHFMGFYEDRRSSRVPNNIHYLVRGDVSKALELAQSGEIDYVYIAFPVLAEERIIETLQKFADSPAKLNLISDPFIDSLVNARSNQVGSIHTISLVKSSFQNPNMDLNRRRS